MENKSEWRTYIQCRTTHEVLEHLTFPDTPDGKTEARIYGNLICPEGYFLLSQLSNETDRVIMRESVRGGTLWNNVE